MHALITFFILAFGTSWAVAGWIHLSGGFAALGTLPSTLALMLFMMGPSLAAVICTALFDRARWATALGLAGFRLGAVAVWTLAGWLTAIILTVGSVLITVHAFSQPLGDPVALMQAQLDAQGVDPGMSVETLLAIQMSAGLLIGFAFNTVFLLVSEELGWRGWLQTRLQGLGFWRVSMVIGLAWGLWHAPIILLGHNYGDMGWAGVAAMLAFTVLLTPYHTLARERGGVIAAAGMHGAINAVAGLSLMYLAAPAWPWNGLLGVGGFAMMALGWIAIALFRQLRPLGAAA